LHLQRDYLNLIVLLTIFLGGIYMASRLDADFGHVKMEEVRIPAAGYELSGLLYIPSEARPDSPRPAVVLAHGISNAKETLSGIALELSRRGVVALTVDLSGHGDSGGSLSSGDPSLGLIDAINFLKSELYVDHSLIGVVGHSLGAGAARRAAYEDDSVVVTVFIGGGVEERSEDPSYGTLSPTFPKNLLMAVGEQDILFDLRGLDASLRQVFGTSEQITIGRLYGSFASMDARELFVTPTIHLLEPITPALVSEVVDWMSRAFASSLPDTTRSGLNYIYREAALALSLIAFVGLIAPLSRIITTWFGERLGERPIVRHRFLRERNSVLVWGGLGLILFLPAMFAGAIVAFPPLVFGSSMAWWLSMTGIFGFIVLKIMADRQSKGNVSIKEVLKGSFKAWDLVLSAAVFVILYSLAWSCEALFTEKLKVIVPLFGSLSLDRLKVLPLFIPFYLVYFTAEGLYLQVYGDRQTAGSMAGNLMRVSGLKMAPYLGLLLVQYIPMFASNFRLIPGFIGFFVEFLWAILPLFLVSTFSSWWLYRLTGRIGFGAIFNSLLFAWVSAGLFPFGSIS
jgi:dienelactone hydrolase